MPIYDYNGLNRTGEVKKGLIDADNAREARERLRNDGIHVTEMKEVADVTKAAGTRSGGISLPRIGGGRGVQTELVIATRQLATLVGAGIPLAEALSALIQQVETRKLEAVLRDTREKIVQGANFADALEAHPSIFTELYVSMVRAGEAAGCLDEILVRLADYMQKQARIRGKVRAAMTYPAFMVIIGIAVVGILMTFVVPKILKVLETQGGNRSLPLPTQVLIFVSDLFTNWWWLMILSVVFAIATFRIYIRSEKGRWNWDHFKLRMPVLGELMRKAAISRFAVTLATLLKSGLPATHALRVVQNVVGNVVLAKAIGDIHDRIVEGADIATPIRQNKLFPPVVGYMVATGEQSGQLDELLERLAEAYDDELEETSQKVTSILEPMMIVALAFVVGGIVFAIVMPMLELANVAR